MQLQTIDLEAVIRVAQRAGQLVVRMQQEGLRNIQGKSNEIDLVTEADLASEALLREELHQLYPEVGFWGEESNNRPQQPFFWVVDPIDGTINFANGVPFYAVNVALHHEETALLGITVELPAGRIYWTKRGEGAFVREADGRRRQLRVNTVTRLRQALLTTGFPYHRAESSDNNSVEFAHFMPRAQGVRCMGSAAMDLAHVAGGVMAGYWEAWLNPWDAAAGALLVREAGGHVTDYNGRTWTLASRSLVASNGQPALHQALLDGIHAARAGLAESLLPEVDEADR